MKHIRICTVCNKEFSTYRDNLQCSNDCFKKSRHVTLVCFVCGNEFDSYLSEQRKRENRNHVPCCSRSCRNSYTSKLLGGDGVWVEGGQYNSKRKRPSIFRRFRRKYMQEVNYTCELCGELATDLHHFIPTAMGGDLLDYDNFVAVCKDCHDNLHQQITDNDFKHEIKDYFDNQNN